MGEAELRAILDMLECIRMGQQRARICLCRGDRGIYSWLSDLAAYYRQLPRSVARRLTEISPAKIEAIAVPYGAVRAAKGNALTELVEGVASVKACAQTLRAINNYLEQLGEPPRDGDGWPLGRGPEKKEGNGYGSQAETDDAEGKEFSGQDQKGPPRGRLPPTGQAPIEPETVCGGGPG